MNKSPFFNILLFIILSIILSTTVFALGMTPAITRVAYEPNLHHEFSFDILNNEHNDMSVEITAEGPLASALSFPPTQTFSSAEEKKTITVTLELPSTIRWDGDIETAIVVTETPTSITSDGTVISTRLAVTHRVILSAPLLDDYSLFAQAAPEPPREIAPPSIEIVSVNVDTFELGHEATFDVVLTNAGLTPVDNVYAIFTVYKENNQVTEFTTDTITLAPQQDTTLTALWESSTIEEGYYTIHIAVHTPNQIVEKDIATQVTTTDIQTNFITGQAVTTPTRTYTLTPTTLAITGGVLVILVILFIVIRIRRRTIDL